MKGKKLKFCLLLSVLCVVATVTCWTVTNVSIGCASFSDSYWALSLSFDKQQMK